MKTNEKRTKNLFKTFNYSENTEEQFEKILSKCEITKTKYKDPNFYPQKKMIANDREKLQNVDWRRIENQYPSELFENIYPESIQQGNLGDCYFIVCLIYASHDVELVKSLFHPKSSLRLGAVLIYFLYLGEKIPVIIDTQVAYQNKKATEPLFSHPRTKNDSIWFVLVEKAYAKACGGYSIIESGMISFGNHVLFNYFSNIYSPIKDIIPIKSLEESDKKVTDENKKIYQILIKLKENKAMLGAATPEEYTEEFKESFGLVNKHAYIILDLKETENKRFIKLQNPLGKSSYKGPYSFGSVECTERIKRELNYKEDEYASFWMLFDDFLRYFEDLDYSIKSDSNWKEMNVFGKIEGYLDGRSPCAESSNVGCIPQWSIKFTKKTIVRLSFDAVGPESYHGIYICKNHGKKVECLDVTTEIKRSTSNSFYNGIEYEVEDFSEPYTFFFIRQKKREEPCYFRILIQSPDVDFVIKKFNDLSISGYMNCASKTCHFNDDESQQWNPYDKERPLSTCRQYYINFPELNYDDETELIFRVYKNVTEGSLHLFFVRTDKRISYSLKEIESKQYEIYPQSTYEEYTIPIDRNYLANDENKNSFKYVFAFYRKELNDVNQFKFSVLSKRKFDFGILQEPDPVKHCCYQIKGKICHDKNDGLSAFANPDVEMKYWRLRFTQWPTQLFIKYSNNNPVTNHIIYLKGSRKSQFVFKMEKGCVHDLQECEVEDISKLYQLYVVREATETTSEYEIKIYGDEEFYMFEIDEDGKDRKVEKYKDYIDHSNEIPKMIIPEVDFIEQPINFKPIRCNPKLMLHAILKHKSLDSISNYILKEIIDQIISEDPLKKELKDIEKYHNFNLVFRFPNGKKIMIEDYNEMSFNEIFESFKKEGFYYSESVINHNFYLSPFVNQLTGYFNDELQISEMNDSIVTLKYDQKQFIFMENECVSDVYKLLRNLYEGNESISIKDGMNREVSFIDDLKADIDYTIYIEYHIKFKFIDDTFSALYMDYLSTVSDAKKKLAGLFKSDDEVFDQKYILLYDHNLSPIMDNEKKLKDIQNLKQIFHFKIDMISYSNAQRIKKQEKEREEKIKSLHNEESESKESTQNEEEESKQNANTKQQQNEEEEKVKADENLQKNSQSNIEEEDSKQKISPKFEEEESEARSYSKIEEESYSFSSAKEQNKSNHSKSHHHSKIDSKKTKRRKSKSKQNEEISSSKTTSDESGHIVRETESKKRLTIIFICENLDQEPFNPIEKSLPIDTTIDEIQDIIAYEYILPKNDFVIKYRENKKKIKVDPRKTIGDISEQIKERQRDGKYRNYLYFEVNSSFKYIKNDYSLTTKIPHIDHHQSKSSYNDDIYYSNDHTYSPKIVKTYDSKFIPRLKRPKLMKSPPKTPTKIEPYKKPASKTLFIISRGKHTRKSSFQSPSLSEPKKEENQSFFVFEYEDKERELSLPNDVPLIELENLIKLVFKIDPNEVIQYVIIKENGEEEMIDKIVANMNSLINHRIKIYLQSQIKKPTIKYHYFKNNDKDVLEIELDQDSTVKSMKKEIAQINMVDDISRITILLNGKELSDNVLLEFLHNGDELFHVEIEEKELFLITETIQNTADEVIFEEEEEDV